MHRTFALALAAVSLPAFADEARFAGDHVAVSLLSEADAFVPGRRAWLGLRLQHEAGWHTYWINPGDSGLPTKLAWTLPEGFRADDIAWPAPRRIAAGELHNFGYEGDVLLPVPVDIPARAASGSNAHVAVKAKWLVCHEECVPGRADLALDVPVRANASPVANNAKPFAAARAAQPQPAPWQAHAQLRGDRIEVVLDSANAPSQADAYALQPGIVAAAPPQIMRKGDATTLVFAKSDYFTRLPAAFDLLLRTDAQHAWQLHVSADPSSSQGGLP